MLALALGLALALQAPAPDTVPAASAAAMAGAYLDPGARELVRRARERQSVSDRSITAYRVVARERISAGVRALSRDRTLFRRELAARILWRREGAGRVEVLGAREVSPAFGRGANIPGKVGNEASNLAFDPAKSVLLEGFGGDDGELRNPLAPGGEEAYRFASGDTARIRLADGRTIRLIELRVTPRGRGPQQLQGSFWLDADSHAPVRASFRFARSLDIARDFEDDDDDVPAVMRPLEANLRFLTIDYALIDGRWWLPRLIALEAEASVASTMRLPVRFERAYEEYEVEAEGSPLLVVAAADSITLQKPGEEKGSVNVLLDGPSGGMTLGYSRPCRREREGGGCWEYEIVQPADSVLLASDLLSDSPYEDEPLISDSEMRELADALGLGIPGQSPWQIPVLRWSYLNPSLVRYNRVEGLALGGRLGADFGPAAVDATLWLPTAAFEPAAEIGVARDGFASRQRLAAYRRLAAVGPDPRALGFGASLSNLLFGRDDADYYRTTGLELTGTPLGTPALRYGWRLFAERQGSAEKHTDFSIPGLFGDDELRPNPPANPADQAGVELGLATGGGAPAGWRWGGDAALLASTGDFAFARPSASAYVGFPLPRALTGLVELAGGTSTGDLPAQSRWFVGGPATVRGYGGADRLAGEAFWRGRAELGTALPAARLSLFSDAGWAGPRSELTFDPPLLSAGAGVSFLDGLFRVDLARSLRGDRGWRLELHMDAVM